jgi:hypothetical protein
MTLTLQETIDKFMEEIPAYPIYPILVPRDIDTGPIYSPLNSNENQLVLAESNFRDYYKITNNIRRFLGYDHLTLVLSRRLIIHWSYLGTELQTWLSFLVSHGFHQEKSLEELSYEERTCWEFYDSNGVERADIFQNKENNFTVISRGFRFSNLSRVDARWFWYGLIHNEILPLIRK